MARRGEGVSRNEVTEKVARHREGLQETAKKIEQTVSDLETIRKTLEELDLGGTSEAADEVERGVEGAEDTTVHEFGQESGQLEEVHRDSEEHEAELQERSDRASSDLGRISDASGRIVTDAANRELIPAKEAALRDVEFLSENAKRARDAREESRRLHDEHDRRVNQGKGV